MDYLSSGPNQRIKGEPFQGHWGVYLHVVWPAFVKTKLKPPKKRARLKRATIFDASCLHKRVEFSRPAVIRLNLVVLWHAKACK